MEREWVVAKVGSEKVILVRMLARRIIYIYIYN